jgi:hypothetical protein
MRQIRGYVLKVLRP